MIELYVLKDHTQLSSMQTHRPIHYDSVMSDASQNGDPFL